MGCESWNETFELTVPSRLEYVAKTATSACELVSSSARARCGGRFCTELELILTEALTNVVRHAHGDTPEKPMTVEMALDPQTLNLAVLDTGPGFDYQKARLPEDPLAESGRGLFLIQRLSDSVEYERSEAGNRLIITKNFLPVSDE